VESSQLQRNSISSFSVTTLQSLVRVNAWYLHFLVNQVETDLFFSLLCFQSGARKVPANAKNVNHFHNRTLSRYRQLINRFTVHACGFVAAVGQRRFSFLLLYIYILTHLSSITWQYQGRVIRGKLYPHQNFEEVYILVQ